MEQKYKSRLISLIVTICLSMATVPVYADTLLIDAITEAPPNDPSGLPRPSSGQTMDKVLARFGEPKEKLAPVGNPPITRWIYDKFTVYFEYNSVVNSAVHLGPNTK